MCMVLPQWSKELVCPRPSTDDQRLGLEYFFASSGRQARDSHSLTTRMGHNWNDLESIQNMASILTGHSLPRKKWECDVMFIYSYSEVRLRNLCIVGLSKKSYFPKNMSKPGLSTYHWLSCSQLCPGVLKWGWETTKSYPRGNNIPSPWDVAESFSEWSVSEQVKRYPDAWTCLIRNKYIIVF